MSAGGHVDWSIDELIALERAQNSYYGKRKASEPVDDGIAASIAASARKDERASRQAKRLN